MVNILKKLQFQFITNIFNFVEMYLLTKLKKTFLLLLKSFFILCISFLILQNKIQAADPADDPNTTVADTIGNSDSDSGSGASAASGSEDTAADNVELNSFEQEVKKAPTKKETKSEEKNIQDEKIEQVTDLTKLHSFNDISVLQKKYLSKTGRFQLSGGVSAIANNPWANTFGINGKFGYHFTEAWGLEASFMAMTGSDSVDKKELQKENDITTSNFVTLKGYYGLDLVWIPIYGKMALHNNKIVPFDMYFSAGGGASQIEGGQGGGTIHIGTGQIFAASKSFGYRWDFSWNGYLAKPQGNEQRFFNDLVLSFGVCFFFPEVNYR